MTPEALKTADCCLTQLETQLFKANELLKDPYFSDVEKLPELVKELVLKGVNLVRNANSLSIEFMQQVQNIITNKEGEERYLRLKEFAEIHIEKFKHETKYLRMVNKALKEMIERKQ